jgi:hypothetical protein
MGTGWMGESPVTTWFVPPVYFPPSFSKNRQMVSIP